MTKHKPECSVSKGSATYHANKDCIVIGGCNCGAEEPKKETKEIKKVGTLIYG